MSVGSSSGFGSSSPSQQRKIEQIVLETLFRLVETVLVNRLRGEELAWLEPSPQEVDSSKYAKLQLRLKSLTGLRKAMKDWKDDIYKPLQLEIWGINTNAESGLTEQSSEPMEGQVRDNFTSCWFKFRGCETVVSFLHFILYRLNYWNYTIYTIDHMIRMKHQSCRLQNLRRR